MDGQVKRREAVVYVHRLPENNKLKPAEISETGRRLLAFALKEQCGFDGSLPPVAKGDQGKPYFPDHPCIEFNISHSGLYVVLALSAYPVGIDVQEISDMEFNAIGKRVLSESEYLDFLRSDNPGESFFRTWVRKEAYVKWTGEGITRELRDLPMDGWYQFIEIDRRYFCAIWAALPLRVEVEEVQYL